MKIAYVSLHWPRTNDSGVGKKIQSQIDAWSGRGHAARMFMHASRHEPQSDLIEGDIFFYSFEGGINKEISRVRAMERTVTSIRNYRPHLIYLRYGMYVLPAHRLMDIAPVIEEINTDDLAQHERLGRFISTYNRWTRGILLRRVRGLVAVSRELALAPAFAGYRKPTRVVSNGIDLDSTIPLRAPNNKIPRLFFMATPGYPWHGIDKLVELARIIPDIVIDVVGYCENDLGGSLPKNIRLHGYMKSTDYLKILSEADADISTLALHRKNMQEASSLKTREYLAFGLPVILPYVDTDLNDLDCSFLLKIPNQEDNIQTHGEIIGDFIFRMRGKRADRRVLNERIGSHQKEKERLEFFEQIIRNF